MPTVGTPMGDQVHLYHSGFGPCFSGLCSFTRNRSEKTGIVLFNLPKGSMVVNEKTGKQLGEFLGEKGLKRHRLQGCHLCSEAAFGSYRFVLEEPSGERHLQRGDQEAPLTWVVFPSDTT